jgi:hypothetical protein
MSTKTGELKMAANTTTWIRRVAAGAVLVAAPALIALGTASASHADTGSPSIRTSPSYAPAPGPLNGQNDLSSHQGSWHQRHAAEQQAKYR